MSDDSIERRVRALGPWFQNMNLAGVWTAPDHFLGDHPATKWSRFAGALPRDLAGKTVLDVGCNAGFFAFEMEARGAARVVGIDEDPRYLAQARLAAEVTGSGVELRQMSVYDVAALGERFDLVLFMGVIYHLRHPLLALDLLWEHVVGDTFVYQSLTRGFEEPEAPAPDYPFEREDIFDRRGWPKLAFVEHRYSQDWTNWWIPNRACNEAMLRSAGFAIVSRPDDDVYLCRRADKTHPAGAVYPRSR